MKKFFKFKILLCVMVSTTIMGKTSQAQTYNFDFTYPDFTTGNPINLSSYLNSGKVVILDFMEYECGPCWTYHQFHVLEDFYAAHGPNGDNTAMVIQMCTYSDADSNKLTWDNGGSWNWLQGISYPTLIIPIADKQNAFGFLNAGTPTILRICPDKTYYKAYPMTPNQSAPSAPYTLTGLNDWMANTCGVTATAVETNEYASIKISAYPNPSSTILNFQGLKEGVKHDFILRNSLGQEVYSIKGNLSLTIDISQYPEGLYFVTIIENGKKHTLKVIIK